MSGPNYPPTGADPTASLTPFPVVIPILGAHHTIPALPASDWLRVLLSEDMDLMELYPGLAGTEAEQFIDDALFDGRLDIDDLSDILHELLTVVSGHPWWFTVRLCTLARDAWDAIGGQLVLRGVDPSRLPLGAWIDAMYAILRELVSGAPRDQVGQLSMMVHDLLRNPETPEDDEGEAFMKAMAGM